MKRKQLAILAALVAVLLATGGWTMAALAPATDIPGGNITVDTTWDLAGSPYNVQGAIAVTNNATLTIEPGVEVRFASFDVSLTIQNGSTLSATGTVADPVRFTGTVQGPENWDGLLISAGATATLAHCEISSGGWPNGGVEGVINIQSSDVSISDCTIRDNGDEGIVISNANITPTISNVDIRDNAGVAIVQTVYNTQPAYAGLTASGNLLDLILLPGGSSAATLTFVDAGLPYEFTSSVVVPNGGALIVDPGVTWTFDSFGDSLDIQSGGVLTATGTLTDSIQFTSRFAGGSNWDGILVRDGAQATLSHCEISRGGWPNGGVEGMVNVQSSDVTISDCTIRDGDDEGLFLGGNGITPTFTNLTIQDNGGFAIQQNTINMNPAFAGLTLSGNGSDVIVTTGGGVTLNPLVLADHGVPYVVLSLVIVGSGAELKLQPGVEWQFDTFDDYLEVLNGGTLTANGTALDPITFSGTTQVGSDNWDGIIARDGSTMSLSHCELSHGGWPNGGVEGFLNIGTSDATISDCTIRDGGDEGLVISSGNITPTISNVDIRDNAGIAIEQLAYSGQPAYADLTASGNLLDLIRMPGGSVAALRTFLNAGLPYEVTSNVIVPDGGTLLLEPGVTWSFDSFGDSLDVRSGGVLTATGTITDPITFTSRSTGGSNWDGILIRSGGQATLAHCAISRGGWPNGGVDGIVQIQSSNVAITNCTISGSDDEGIVVSSSQPTLRDNVIANNAAGGVINTTPATEVDARFNFWGAPSGPFHPVTNPDGLGNGVSDGVLYTPFYDSAARVKNDLAVDVTGFTVPATVDLGSEATFTYRVQNLSPEPVVRTLEDALYLSTDTTFSPDDRLIARVFHTGGVAGFGSYSKTVSAPVLGLPLDEYHLIVVNDPRQTIPDPERGNNDGASAATVRAQVNGQDAFCAIAPRAAAPLDADRALARLATPQGPTPLSAAAPAPTAPSPIYTYVAQPPTNETILLTDSGFSPATLNTIAGTTVIWRNDTATTQTIDVFGEPVEYMVFLPVAVTNSDSRGSGSPAATPAANRPVGNLLTSFVLPPGGTHSLLLDQAATYTYNLQNEPATGGEVNVAAAPALTLDPIGDQTAELGRTLSFTLTAGGAGDLLFSAVPLPLPRGMTLDSQTGVVSFRPNESQVGDHLIVFAVSDGYSVQRETVTITVPPASGSSTSFSGVILNANNITEPLVGATVRDVNSGQSTVTDATGAFTLDNLAPGYHYFEFDASTATPAGTFGAYRSERTLIANVDNVVERPIYIMPLDTASTTTVDPNQTTIVFNPNLDVTVEIPPNTVVDDNGDLYAGTISVSPVPPTFTPASLPPTMTPDQVLTIQPMGLTFNNPAPITFPNTAGLAAGSEVDLWSMDHETSQFFIAGRGRVTPDGTMIETIEGGIRESSWHFPLPPVPPSQPPDSPGDGPPPCEGCAGSTVQFNDGNFTTAFTLPATVSQGQSRALTFVYESERAFPSGVLPLEFTQLERAVVPQRMGISTAIGGLNTSEMVFVDMTGVPELGDQTLRVVTTLNVDGLPTGVYPTDVTFDTFLSTFAPGGVALTNQGAATSVTTLDVVVENESDSPFGAGWGIAGLSRLYFNQEYGRVLIADGDGNVATFIPEGNLTGFSAEGDQTDSRWVVAADGALASQNGEGNETQPTFLVSDRVYADVSFAGTFRVSDFADDDYIGLVLGYQAPDAALGIDPDEQFFVLFDWKQAAETIAGIPVDEGFRLSCVAGSADLIGQTGDIFPVADLLGPGSGWEDNLRHTFRVDYRPDRVTIVVDEVVVFDQVGNFPPGKIGFFNLSQTGATYTITSIVDSGGVERFTSQGGDFSELTRNMNGSFTRRMADGTLYEYDNAGLLTEMIDRNGNTTSYSYDAGGRLTSITDPVGQTTALTYSGGLLSSVTDPAGRVTSFTHDDQGNLTGVNLPDATSRSFAYDSRHLLVGETNERGETFLHSFNEVGQIVGAVWPDGSERQFTIANSIGLILPGESSLADAPPAVFAADVASSFTNGLGMIETYATGRYGEETGRIDMAGLETIRDRDADGNLVRLVEPSGVEYAMTYDDQGNLLTWTDETLGGTVTMAYDAVFNQVTQLTDPFGDTTFFEYDANGNLTALTSPLGRSLQFGYDARGNITSEVAFWGTESTFTYDVNDNLTGSVAGSGPEQRLTTMTYSPEGYLETLTDAENRSYNYTYNAYGQLLSETLPGNHTVTYTYDDAGNLLTVTPPGRPAHSYTYNELGLVTSYQPPTVAGGGTGRTDYAYNLAQQLTSVTRPDGIVLSYGFDTAGRPITLTTPLGDYTTAYDPATGLVTSAAEPTGNSLSYAYDGDYLTEVTAAGAVNGSVSYEYDAAGRVSGIGVNGDVVHYSYDADGAIVQAGSLILDYEADTGLLSGTTAGSVSDTTTYNQFGEMESYSASFEDEALYAVDYTYDGLGRLVQKVETVLGVTDTYDYSYDDAGRLETVEKNSVVVESYTYDANGNRLSDGTNSATYDDQDRLLTYGDATYTYTANGELLTKTESGQTTTYDYDVMGNLRSVTLPDGTVRTYEIDAANRRIGAETDGTLNHTFLYRDELNPAAQLNGSGSLISRFVYAANSSVPSIMLHGGALYTFVVDHLGSVRLVVNAVTGDVVQRIDYDSFGRVIADTNPGFQPFGYTGGLYDATTGLVRLGARDYDPATGRWTAQDPIRFAGGQSNLYIYVNGEPINHTDVTGLDSDDSGWWEWFKTTLGLGAGTKSPSGTSEFAGAAEAGTAISASDISGIRPFQMLVDGTRICSTPELRKKSSQLLNQWGNEIGGPGGNVAQVLQFIQANQTDWDLIKADLAGR